ncbi:hypothetical protein HDV00_010673 [Rhizophlyctis rosea]|nr:hypothetical protein HDV00_010673 [Rhizophlyctis rosea]
MSSTPPLSQQPAQKSTMRAIVATAPGIVELKTDYPKPLPQTGHILIKVKAFSINPFEITTLKSPPASIKFPRVWGCECVGIVEDNGGMENVRIGSVIAAICGGLGRDIDGGFAEYVSAPYTSTYPLRIPVLDPSTPLQPSDWTRLASIPTPFLTAFGVLNALNIRPKHRLLIRGAASPVGMAMISVARHLGCTVAVTVKGESGVEGVREAGAGSVLLERDGGVECDVRMVFDGVEDSSSAVKGAKTEKRESGADKIADLLTTTLPDSLSSLAPNGICCLLSAPSSPPSAPPSFVIPKSGTYLTTFDPATLEGQLHRTPLQEIVERAVKGVYKVHVGRSVDLEGVVGVLQGEEGEEGVGGVCWVGEV